MLSRPRIKSICIFLAFTAIYFAGGKLGLMMAARNTSASAFWPPTGIALAAMLILGFRYWPAIFLGALLVNFTTHKEIPLTQNVLASLAIASGNTLEAVIGALLARTLGRGLASFERTDDVFRYVFFAAIPSNAISATIGVAALVASGNLRSGNLAPVWFTWWLGDFTSNLLVAPLLIVWFTHKWISFSRRAIVEAAALLVTILAISMLVFGVHTAPMRRDYPLEYLAIPILIWAAFRFTQIGAVTSAAALSIISVIGTWRGIGPFAVSDRNDALLLLQMFVGVSALTALVLAAAVAERQHDQNERDALLRREAQARAEAERANLAKDQFLAVLSHELRTPLTPVMLSAAMLESHPELPEALRADLHMIRQNVELEARLIDDLLDLTRVTRGKLQLEMQTVDLHTVIQRAIDICLRDSALQLDVKLAAHPSTVRGDPARLQQVFWNLLNNARKFTPAGGRISIASRTSSDGNFVEVEVSDTGEGIDAELLPKLFDAFEQGTSFRASRSGGLGLGLAISRALVTAHRGSLAARSEGRGRGSTFVLQFPVTNGKLGVSSRGDSDGSSRAGAEVARPLKILLVEDHENTLNVMRVLLSGWHHDVTCATSVKAAVEASEREKFDLLISDLGLPDGAGHEIMRSVRDRYALKGIALSGFGMDADIEKSRQAGFAEHLTKPISMDALEAAISRVTSR